MPTLLLFCSRTYLIFGISSLIYSLLSFLPSCCYMFLFNQNFHFLIKLVLSSLTSPTLSSWFEVFPWFPSRDQRIPDSVVGLSSHELSLGKKNYNIPKKCFPPPTALHQLASLDMKGHLSLTPTDPCLSASRVDTLHSHV